MTWTPQNIKNTAGPAPANSNPDEGMGFLQRQQLERDRALMVKRASAQMSEQHASVAPSNTPDLSVEAPWAQQAIDRDRALNESRAQPIEIDPSFGHLQQAQIERDIEINNRRAADAAVPAVAPTGEHFLVTQARERDRLHAERCRASAHTPAPKAGPAEQTADHLPQTEVPVCVTEQHGPDTSLSHTQRDQYRRDAEHRRKRR